MTSLTNYSKWDNIQLSSDDDEDCHPNIEKFTWRRLRAQQRAQKRVEDDQESGQIEAEIVALQTKIADLKRFPATAMTQASIATHEKKIADHRRYLEKKEAVRKLDPDDLCTEAFDRTSVNKNAELEHVTPPALQKKLDDGKEINAEDFSSWQTKNQEVLEEYMKCDTVEKTAAFVKAHPQLLDTNATGWILLHALEKEMGGDSAGMHHAVRQNQFLQYPMDLAKLTNQAPAAAAASFFERIARPQQRAMFEKDVDEFALKIKARAVEKKKEQMGRAGQVGPELPTFKEGDTEYQVLSKAERMGKGGLDPLEVLETLPPAMKAAFMEGDIPMLHKALETMTVEDAQYHMGRARKSGLWVDGGDSEEGAAAAEDGGKAEVAPAAPVEGGGVKPVDSESFGTKVAYAPE